MHLYLILTKIFMFECECRDDGIQVTLGNLDN